MKKAPVTIRKKVSDFKRDFEIAKLSPLSEADLRKDYINPFFSSLGWDISNRKGAPPHLKEVVVEEILKDGETKRFPDYTFRLGGERIFFVEAKKSSVNIDNDPQSAYQLRKYAWSAKLSLSILTDFEEFAVYDTRVKPKVGDSAKVCRIMYENYKNYEEKWDKIYHLFSPEAVLNGAFDQYTESLKKLKGISQVDDEFLSEIEGWRNQLARHIGPRNTNLDVHDINYVVQKIIDRIIFLRLCEDRGIEKDEQLKGLLSKENIYKGLCTIFQRADNKYNSGLFHFHDEPGKPTSPDTLSLSVNIEDKVLRPIIKNLYYPVSPYEFSVIPPEILGQVYEQFLGKVIRLTPSNRAKVEEKPEVAKAGGVKYTPQYIVNSIVREALEPFCKDKTPSELASLRILDPACGSGSFLLGVYSYLLNSHLEYFSKQKRKRKDYVYISKKGEFRLTMEIKKKILANNIYGVDIDPQAVEVTKLSLLLKALEGETSDIIESRRLLFQDRVLPDLGDNIKCGNSLIGSEYYRGRFLSDEEIRRVKPFDWKSEFPEIFKEKGGFDCIVGNPPYIRVQTMQEWAPTEVEYYKSKYRSASKGNYDIYLVFIERALQLLNDSGKMGYIVPHKFFNAQYGKQLRELLSDGDHVSHIVNFGHLQIFKGATTYTCLLFLDMNPNDRFQYEKVSNLMGWKRLNESKSEVLPSETLSDEAWNIIIGKGKKVFERLDQHPVKLGDIASHIAQGIRTSANEIYVLQVEEIKKGHVEAFSKALNRTVKLEHGLLHHFLKGREIKPFEITSCGQIVIIPYKKIQNKYQLIPEVELSAKYPLTYSYLLENKKYLEGREHNRMKGKYWYGYVYPKNIDVMKSVKILVPDIAERASFAFDEEGKYAFTSGYGIILNDEVKEEMEYFIALLNSNVLDFFLKQESTVLRGGYFRFFTQFIEPLPIRRINFTNKKDKKLHSDIVILVKQRIQINEKIKVGLSPNDRDNLQHQLSAIEREINQIVYELYDLSTTEIQIIEEESCK